MKKVLCSVKHFQMYFLKVWPAQGMLDTREVRKKLENAKIAADAQRSDALERSSSGTGQILRANFLLLLEAVLGQDSHLLDSNEMGFIETYRVSNLYLECYLLNMTAAQSNWRMISDPLTHC